MGQRRKNLMMAFFVVTIVSTVGLAIRDDRTLAPENPSQPIPRELTMRSQVPLHGDLAYVESAALSQDCKYLAMGGHKNGSAAWASLWNASTGQKLAALPGHTRAFKWMAFNLEGRILASASEGVVQFWNVASQREEMTLRTSSGGDVTAVAFANDNTTMATGDEKGGIRLRDVSTGREKAILQGHKSVVHCLAFSPDGRRLASGGKDGTVRLWDVLSGQVLAILRRHSHEVRSVVFAPDGQILASGSEDRRCGYGLCPRQRSRSRFADIKVSCPCWRSRPMAKCWPQVVMIGW